jgi:hypothetical protein
MNNLEIIKAQFEQLAEKYGLAISDETSSPTSMGDARVLYLSDAIGLEVVVNRRQVLVTLGDPTGPDNSWFEWIDVINFYAPKEEVYVFWDKRRKKAVDVETQAARIAHLLERYCRPLLEGDFSHAAQIRELERERVSEMRSRFKEISKRARDAKARR